MNRDQEYVLGTHDEELERLGLQHRVWRPRVLKLWSQLGIREGSRVIDMGCGPGFATADLAETVGKQGKVVAVERSSRYAAACVERCGRLGLKNVTMLQRDLMEGDLDEMALDAAWCRWVGMFVSDVGKLARQAARVLKPGGIAMFHEYLHYDTLAMAPKRKAIDEFVQQVIASFRDAGGDPEVGQLLPTHLAQAGFEIERTEPIVFAARPHDYEWQWPASFIDTYVYRLVELKRVDLAWAEWVRKEFHAAESHEGTMMVTPMLVEIVARKR